MAVCKEDTLLTGEMKFLKNSEDSKTFSILIVEDGPDSNQAVKTALLRLSLYLDFYNLYYQQAFEIADNQTPFVVSAVKDGIIQGESFAFSFELPSFFLATSAIKDEMIKILVMLSEPRNGFLRIALDYHRRLKLEKEATNELIHLFITLEALYATENEKQEIAHKMASRIATLLAKNTSSRIALFKRAKKLYNLRSKIVHGSSNFKADNIEDALDWGRESILRFMTLIMKYPNKKHQDIINEIDNAMLDNKIRTKLRKDSEDLIKNEKESQQKVKSESKLKQKSDSD